MMTVGSHCFCCILRRAMAEVGCREFCIQCHAFRVVCQCPWGLMLCLTPSYAISGRAVHDFCFASCSMHLPSADGGGMSCRDGLRCGAAGIMALPREICMQRDSAGRRSSAFVKILFRFIADWLI